MISREWIMETARRVYRSYGFNPIDTPALEHLDILTGKGSEETDKQMYRFEDPGGRMVGMRFDLTIPLARFVAQHIQTLGTPFKRYQIATVWRGENPQAGRYREFMQCDFDTIGTTSPATDIETVLIINDLFVALGFEQFTIRMNNRLILSGLLQKIGLTEQTTRVLRALDKLPKIGPEAVAAELATAAGAVPAQSEAVLQLASLAGDNSSILAQLEPLLAGNEMGEQGLAQLTDLQTALVAAGVPPDRLQLDVSIARGLDYYTGMVVETFLDELPEIGSVCSGGRYDNLAQLYTHQELPGVGASLGLDRLLAAMEELGRLEPVQTTADVFIPFFDAARRNDYLCLAAKLRAAGIATEFYPDPKKLGKQLQYADRRGFGVALILGDSEFSAGACQVKNLLTGESQTVPLTDDLGPVLNELSRVVKSAL
jgi:histidyl-tRNA synthetase